MRISRAFLHDVFEPIIIRHVVVTRKKKVTQMMGIITDIFKRVDSFPPKLYNFCMQQTHMIWPDREREKEMWKKAAPENFVWQINILITFRLFFSSSFQIAVNWSAKPFLKITEETREEKKKQIENKRQWRPILLFHTYICDYLWHLTVHGPLLKFEFVFLTSF